MKFWNCLILPLALMLINQGAMPGWANPDEGIEKIETAVQAFEDIMADPRSRIPASVLADSEGIAIIPNLVQGGVLFGGRLGRGVMVVRQEDGSWSNPAFVNLSGVSFGFQFGGRSSDVALIFRNRDHLEELIDLNGQYRFGVGTAGTVGSINGNGIDPTERGEDVVFYSRSFGLFGGATLGRGRLGFDEERNEAFYDLVNLETEEILVERDLELPEDALAAFNDLLGVLGGARREGIGQVLGSETITPGSRPTTITSEATDSATILSEEELEPFDLAEAQAMVLQTIEAENGGSGQYQAESAMYGKPRQTPHHLNPDQSWTFTFKGGRPNWERYGKPATVQSVVTVSPTGRVTINYNSGAY